MVVLPIVMEDWARLMLVTGWAGVTAFEADDAELVPAELVAVTKNM